MNVSASASFPWTCSSEQRLLTEVRVSGWSLSRGNSYLGQQPRFTAQGQVSWSFVRAGDGEDEDRRGEGGKEEGGARWCARQGTTSVWCWMAGGAGPKAAQLLPCRQKGSSLFRPSCALDEVDNRLVTQLAQHLGRVRRDPRWGG